MGKTILLAGLFVLAHLRVARAVWPFHKPWKIDKIVHATGLSPVAVKSLENGTKNFLLVRIFKRDDQVIVKIAESHSQLHRSFKAGKEILGHFDVRGVESLVEQPLPPSALGRFRFKNIELSVPPPVVRQLFSPSLISEAIGQGKVVLLEVSPDVAFKDSVPQFITATHHEDATSHLMDFVSKVRFGAGPFVALGVHPQEPLLSMLYGLAVPAVHVGIAHLLDLLGYRDMASRFDPVIWHVKRRDKAMAKNLDAFLDQHPNIRQMLVVTGAYHRHGMTRELKERGFEVVPTR